MNAVVPNTNLAKKILSPLLGSNDFDALCTNLTELYWSDFTDLFQNDCGDVQNVNTDKITKLIQIEYITWYSLPEESKRKNELISALNDDENTTYCFCANIFKALNIWKFSLEVAEIE
mgnify:CR=1 FL=1